MGLKTADDGVFPLCAPHWGLPGCHFQLDNSIGMNKAERRKTERAYGAKMKELAVKAGWFPELRIAASGNVPKRSVRIEKETQ
jgi:hypothetical protein